MIGRLWAVLRPINDGLWIEIETLGRDSDGLHEPLKAVLSVLLAVAIAIWLNLPDIVWAAISGFLVMRSSVAEAAPRALFRVVGSIAGALLGLVLARWIAGDPGLLMAVVFALTWVAVYQGSVSKYRYAWLLFGATAVIVLIAAFSAPSEASRFAAVRAAEVTIGSLAALAIAALFELCGAPFGAEAPQTDASPGTVLTWHSLWNEEWLRRNWPVVIHATQAAVGVSLLPLLWRWFEIVNFVQTAVTSFIVMIIPLNAIETGARSAIYERIAHRLLGCILGGALALLCLGISADDRVLWTLCLAAGVWIGFRIQSGTTGLSYLGTQFGFAFMVAFVQGPGAATSLNPPLERLLGVLIGSVMTSLVILVWPSRPVARSVSTS